MAPLEMKLSHSIPHPVRFGTLSTPAGEFEVVSAGYWKVVHNEPGGSGRPSSLATIRGDAFFLAQAGDGAGRLQSRWVAIPGANAPTAGTDGSESPASAPSEFAPTPFQSGVREASFAGPHSHVGHLVEPVRVGAVSPIGRGVPRLMMASRSSATLG